MSFCAQPVLQEGQNGHQEPSEEVTALTFLRCDSGLDQGGLDGGDEVRSCIYSEGRTILISDELDVSVEKKEGSKMDGWCSEMEGPKQGKYVCVCICLSPGSSGPIL